MSLSTSRNAHQGTEGGRERRERWSSSHMCTQTPSSNKEWGDSPRPWLTGDSVLGDISAGEPMKGNKKTVPAHGYVNQ